MGGITVAELVTRWGFDVNPAALTKLEQALKKVQGPLGAVGWGIASIGVAAGAILTGVAAMVTTTAAAGENALKTAQKVGIHVERLQELQYAAKMADVEQQELTIGLKFLSTKLYDAANGSAEAKKGLKNIGIEAKDSSGRLRSADDALADVADRFAAMPDGAKKTALAVDLFGRSGINMIPMLNQGSGELRKMAAEARRLGLVMDEQTARRGEELMDTIKRLQSVVVGIKREIGVAFLPVMLKMAKGLFAWILANRELISQRVTQFITALGQALAYLVPVMGRAIELGGLLFGMIDRLTQGAGGLTAIFKIMATALLAPFLVIDDIVAYFQGKDSLLGRFIGLMQKELPILGSKIMQFFTPVEGIIRSIAEQLRYIWKIATDLINLFKSPAASFFQSLGAVWGMNKNFMGKGGMGGKALGWLGGALDPSSMIGGLNAAGAGQANFLRWMDPTMSPAMVPAGAMAAGAAGALGFAMGDIVINIGGAGNAQETGAAVGSAVKESLDQALRQAQRDLKKTVVR